MKMTVHNITEVKALIKESINSGDVEKFNGAQWFSHNGEYICRSFTSFEMFHLELPNVTTETIRLF